MRFLVLYFYLDREITIDFDPEDIIPDLIINVKREVEINNLSNSDYTYLINSVRRILGNYIFIFKLNSDNPIITIFEIMKQMENVDYGYLGSGAWSLSFIQGSIELVNDDILFACPEAI